MPFVPAPPPRARSRPGPCRRPARRARRGARGFTLVELVVVMLLLAVLSGIGMSRWGSRAPLAVQSVADQIVSGLRQGQALARAQRATVHVQLGAVPATLALCLDAACTQPLAPPGGGAWVEDNDGVQLAAALTFAIDAAGTPSFAAAQTVVVTSSDGAAPARSIRIEPGSGHVQLP